MARNSEQVVKEIQRNINQKYVSVNSFEQCMGIWQIFKKGMFGKELKEEFPCEYEIIYKIFKEINIDNIQLSTLHFLHSFVKFGKLHTLNDNVLEITLGQTFKEGTSETILKEIQKLYLTEKETFIEECTHKYTNIFNYDKSIYVGRSVPIKIMCNRCDEILLQTPESHIKAKFPCMTCAIHIESWEPPRAMIGSIISGIDGSEGNTGVVVKSGGSGGSSVSSGVSSVSSGGSSTNNGSACVHVFNGLYISDIYGAQNVNWLQSSGFGGIIDASNAPNVVKFPRQMEVLRIPVDDNVHSKIRPYFLKTQQFIDHHIGKKKKVLVFCRAGISRSATIVINYLLKTFSMSVDEAILFLKKKRPQIQPNSNFLQQLRDEMSAYQLSGKESEKEIEKESEKKESENN